MLCEIDNFRYLTNISGLSLLDGTYLERLICSFYSPEKFVFERIVDLKDLKIFFETESITGVKDILFRLASQGDILLIEQVDRISRLNAQDWELLKTMITTKGIAIVALDLPTSYQFIKMDADNFMQRMLVAINSMMLDMLAAVARKDYEDRRRRQAEGIEKAKKIGKYKGRRMNHNLHENIIALLKAGKRSQSFSLCKL